MVPPPAVPPGWVTGPPDYVGVGTIRSGTTWWNYLIRCHPGVAWPPARRKEVHYFDQFSGARLPDPDVYYAYFPRPEGLLCGEWTPRYMSDAWTAGLLAQLASTARLLVLLRDPVERVVSTLTYIRYKFRRELHGFVISREFGRSLYWRQLRGLLEYFPREQVLVLQYERCVADLETEAARTFEFLGLDPGQLRLTDQHGHSRNPTRWPKVVLDEDVVARFGTALRPDLRGLARDFPEVDQSLWPSAAL
jgi:hypothetical protein